MQQLRLQFESVEDIFLRVFREVNPRGGLPEIAIQFYPYAGLKSTIRLEKGRRRIRVRLSDLLQAAPAGVQEAAAGILLAKLYRKQSPETADAIYSGWMNSPQIRQRTREARRLRGRKRIGQPRGKHRDLDVLFADLNRRFFDGSLRKPALGWSRGESRRMLGHYDPAHDAIVISRVFDRPNVPLLLLEYVLYHEMLHVKHPVEMRRRRRCVHTPAFRAEERRFPRCEEVKRLLLDL